MTKVNGREDFGVMSLCRKREEIIDRISETEVVMQNLVLQLTHVDATLKMLRPEISLAPPPQRPLAKKSYRRGGHMRIVLTALHEAKGPITLTDLTRAYLIANGKPALRISRDARETVRHVLRNLAAKKAVRQNGSDGPAVTWELVRGD